MPFTLSHAAAAWPFRRTRLELSALITGCFAPDFPYFILLWPHSPYGHTLPGIFLFDLPASLVALWLFHAYVKRPLIMFLPRTVRCRINSEGEFSFRPPARLAMIVLSILIGIVTHIVWDSFTHPSFWPYQHLSILRETVHLPIHGNVGVSKLLQHGSTLFGIAFLAIWAWHWYGATKPDAQRDAEPINAGERRVIIVLVPIFAICAAIVYELIRVGVPARIGKLLYFVAGTGLPAITFFCVGLLVCGVLLRKRAATPEANPGR
jgi:hypothetical protein